MRSDRQMLWLLPDSCGSVIGVPAKRGRRCEGVSKGAGVRARGCGRGGAGEGVRAWGAGAGDERLTPASRTVQRVHVVQKDGRRCRERFGLVRAEEGDRVVPAVPARHPAARRC